MKKNFLLLSFVLLNVISSVQAQDMVLQSSPEYLMQKLKNNRGEIYKSLNLTQEQIQNINNIDEKFYMELEPELQQVSVFIQKVQEIAESDNCTIKRVNEVKKDFKATDNRISVIKCRYDKAVKKQLSCKQKRLYKNAKKQQYLELKKRFLRKICTKNNLRCCSNRDNYSPQPPVI